jgi:multidrug efflux pump subunit AcrA (membrane-fusion protein)
MTRIVICCILFISSISFAQTVNLTPTDLENAQLAKLKAQRETLQAQTTQIDIQIQGLQALKQLLNEHSQQKYSEFLAQVDKVKKAHKDWGEESKINFNENQGESGVFSKEDKKQELPVPLSKPPQGQVKK